MKIRINPRPDDAEPPAAPAKKRRNRPTVLIPTTPAKLAKLIGEDTPVMVGRKSLGKALTRRNIEGL